MFEARKVAQYRVPEKTTVEERVVEGSRLMLVRGAEEGLERFGVFYGNWKDDELVIRDTLDKTEEYAEERHAGSVRLHNWAREELKKKTEEGRLKQEGFVGQCHIHLGGHNTLPECDRKHLDSIPAGVMGIIHYDIYCGMGIEIYHANPEPGGGPISIFNKTVPDAAIPPKALGTLKYYWEFGDADLFG